MITIYPIPKSENSFNGTSYSEEKPFDIYKFADDESFPYEIIDIERLKPGYEGNTDHIKFYIGITAVIPNSYTNVLTIYSCTLSD